ncbi:hypothetical protein [Roseobacter sp. CCS2]|uniref:hypothetical protein n=1 Tax=Roseobacter sp. CCS2 TaxID=391593 RepID=UPI0000F40145|nr:hypothetical protein [Roseobacter sp. CCS2]EBA13274.1 hypothetical protein RCCS2_05294 [Roseobacter sp. CCS2]
MQTTRPNKRKPQSYSGLEDLGRVRLSQHFFMRDFLYSEIGNFHGIQNIPDDPNLAIMAGEKLCEELLDPLTETFGPIAVRSAYRSPSLNHYGATQAKPQRCSRNEVNYAHHIWDIRDGKGRMGACASIVIPWFADQFDQGRDWRDLAWWIHDHLPYHAMYFFPKLAAFNLTWRENPDRTIGSYIAPKGTLLGAGKTPAEDDKARAARYADFPAYRGISYPAGRA